MATNDIQLAVGRTVKTVTSNEGFGHTSAITFEFDDGSVMRIVASAIMYDQYSSSPCLKMTYE